MKICGENAFADHETAETYLDKFGKLVVDEGLPAEQVYNAD